MNGIIRIFDIKQRRVLSDFETNDNTNIVEMCSSSDSNHVVIARDDQSIQAYLNPFNQDCISVFISNSITPYGVYGSLILNQFLTKESTAEKIKVIDKYPNLVIYPYNWNFFHLACILCPSPEIIRFCLTKKIPFTIDTKGKNPIHYLFGASVVQYSIINTILGQFHECLPTDQALQNSIINSFTDVLPQITTVDSPEVADFFNSCFF